MKSLNLNIPFNPFDRNIRERFNFSDDGYYLVVNKGDYEILKMYRRLDEGSYFGSLYVMWQPNDIVAPGTAYLTNKDVWNKD